MQIKLKWWTIFCFSILIITISWFFGFIHQLYENDITKLSWLILGLFFLFSLRLGYKLHLKKTFDTVQEWFVSETMLSIGMIGTVVGFIYMLTTVFTDINVDDTASVQDALAIMATGMGTALWTTLIGLVCSVILKLQLVLIDESTDG
tara:strand:- start:1132 stop:1575 length:444 start_codon:yes stop_codon:yes gene_type:complete